MKVCSPPTKANWLESILYYFRGTHGTIRDRQKSSPKLTVHKAENGKTKKGVSAEQEKNQIQGKLVKNEAVIAVILFKLTAIAVNLAWKVTLLRSQPLARANRGTVSIRRSSIPVRIFFILFQKFGFFLLLALHVEDGVEVGMYNGWYFVQVMVVNLFAGSS